MKKFGDRLRAWREAKGITLYWLAKEYGVSQPNLSSIEKGRRPASEDVLRKLASIPELELSYDLLKAWQRLDGATGAECAEIFKELLSLPNAQGPARDTYKQAVKDFFQSLPREAQLELLGVNREMLLNEMRNMNKKER